MQPAASRQSITILALSGVGTILLCALLWAGPGWAVALYRLLIDGPLLLLWLAGAAGIGLLLRVPAKDTLRAVTATALGIGVLSLLCFGLGWAGWLNAPVAYGLLIAGAAYGVFHVWTHWPASIDFGGRVWLWLLLAPVVGLMVAAALVPPGILWSADDPAGYDVVEYHLQLPREWYEAGRVTPLPHNVFSFMPMNVEMYYLLAMHLRGGPWAGMYLAQLMHTAMFLLTAVAVYGVCRELGAGRGMSGIGAAIFLAAPWTPLLGSVAYNEGGLLLFGTLAVGWMLRVSSWREAALAGAFAGFACGSKLTAVPLILGGLVVALLGTRIKMPASPAPLAHARGSLWGVIGVFLLAGLLTLSPWLIRNRIWTGNPVFPEAMPLLGHGHFSPQQVERWQTAHRPREDQRSVPARLAAAWRQIALDWRYGYFILPLGLAAMLAQWRRWEMRILLILFTWLLVFWLTLTHLQSRFFVFALPLAGLAIGITPWRRWMLTALILAAVPMVPALMQMESLLSPWRGLIGLADFHPLMESLLPEGTRIDEQTPLVLAGDARAFWYPIPHLRYRTIFDLPPTEDPIAGWIGPEPLPPGSVIVVNPGELRRFAATYRYVASPDQSLPQHLYVLQGQR